MKSELTKIERLDLAAQAEAASASLRIFRPLALILAGFIVFLAVMSEASFNETLICGLLGGSAVLAAITLLLRWRYCFHTFAFLFGITGVVYLIFGDGTSHEPLLRGIASRGYVLSFIVATYYTWKKGKPFALITAPGWDRERTQVHEWLQALQHRSEGEPVVEVPSGSFWRGFSTYRILQQGDLCCVSTFRTKDLKRLYTYRVYPGDAVRLTENTHRSPRLVINDQPA